MTRIFPAFGSPDTQTMRCSTARAEDKRNRCSKVQERLQSCKLEMHPGKTRIVYCRDINRPAAYPVTQFTFLGYTFRPRKAVDKYGRVYVNFAPAVSRDALTAMRQTVRGWHLQLKCDRSLEDLSRMFGPSAARLGDTTTGDFTAPRCVPLWYND